MIHIKINLLFGVLILCSYLIAQGNADINACVNCNTYACDPPQGNETGFGVFDDADKKKIKKVDANSNSEANLPCIPNIYEIEGTLRHTVCFWNPELGCRPVRPLEKISKKTEDSSCELCRQYGCPCEGSSLQVWHIGMETMCLSLILISNLVAYNVKL